MYFSYERYVAVEITILGKCAVKETSLIFFIFVFSQINQTSLCTANYILFQRNISLIKAKMFFVSGQSQDTNTTSHTSGPIRCAVVLIN